MIRGLNDIDYLKACDEIAGTQHGEGEDDERLYCNVALVVGVMNRIGNTECPHIAIIR